MRGNYPQMGIIIGSVKETLINVSLAKIFEK
jgi:hypothetical protein